MIQRNSLALCSEAVSQLLSYRAVHSFNAAGARGVMVLLAIMLGMVEARAEVTGAAGAAGTTGAEEATAGASAERHVLLGSVVEATTLLGVNDSIAVQLLAPDSTVVASSPVEIESWSNSSVPGNIHSSFVLTPDCPNGHYTLRLSHPDYETASYPLELTGGEQNLGRFKIRRLTSYEQAVMLGELTVTASVVQFVNRGDTLSYNADSFALAQGSMLDALVRELPGVELREGGQIYVNNRFVDRLLLDGKDFFVGDKLVLLQNLPAYTVKSIDVYEQASPLTATLGKSAGGVGQRDLYVMDVVLKKGYNNGWLANAEAGAGTHGRYRGRAFAMTYTPKVRLGAYGFANNVNETGTPGSDGDWSSPADKKGDITTRGGGIDYLYSKKDNSFEINGSAIAKHNRSIFGSHSTRQNFLPGGDTYTRRWTDRRLRDFSLDTRHTLKFRPAEGYSYYGEIELGLRYNDIKDRSSSREGTVSSNTDDPDFYSKLLTGFGPADGLVNRYLTQALSASRPLQANARINFLRMLGSAGHSLSVNGSASFTRSNTDGADAYLLQYGSTGPEQTERRLNPVKARSYSYELNPSVNIRLAQGLTLHPGVGVTRRYNSDSNNWYRELDASTLQLPSMAAHARMDLDPRNSYDAAIHHTHETFKLSLNYYKPIYDDNQEVSRLTLTVTPAINVVQQRIHYHGTTPQTVNRNYVTPQCRFSLYWYLRGMAPMLNLEYSAIGNDIDMMDLVDRSYSADPLFVHTGARYLRPEVRHEMSLRCNSNKEFFNRLSFNSKVTYECVSDRVAMSSAYDAATGVRTSRPVNVDGNNYVHLWLQGQLSLDRRKRFVLFNSLNAIYSHVIDMLSENNFESTERTAVYGPGISNTTDLSFTTRGYSVSLTGGLNRMWLSSRRPGFSDVDVAMYRYGIEGRARLPWGFEISSDLKMYSNRGFDDPGMNTNTLVWNARLTKSLFHGQLLLAAEGYDMLRRIRSITYSSNAQGITQTWSDTLPGYFMFSARWTFKREPRN